MSVPGGAAGSGTIYLGLGALDERGQPCIADSRGMLGCVMPGSSAVFGERSGALSTARHLPIPGRGAPIGTHPAHGDQAGPMTSPSRCSATPTRGGGADRRIRLAFAGGAFGRVHPLPAPATACPTTPTRGWWCWAPPTPTSASGQPAEVAAKAIWSRGATCRHYRTTGLLAVTR